HQPEIVSAPVQQEHLERVFTPRVDVIQPVTQPDDPSLRDAAAIVLEANSTLNVKTSTDQLLGTIQQQVIATPQQGNDLLQVKNDEIKIATMHDSQQIIGKDPVVGIVSSVPLPKSIPSMPDLDDLDI
ncbi:MAG: hypothetical protein QNL55_07160, partial [Euryarchaeota archaeon]